MNPWVHHHRIRLAAQALHRGAVVAYPTEAVWGLGCAPYCEQAVDHILALVVPEEHGQPKIDVGEAFTATVTEFAGWIDLGYGTPEDEMII